MIQKVASQRHGTQVDPGRRVLTPTEITEQLSREFPDLDREIVWRWVRDTVACVRHLDVGADPFVVERLAREHLTAIVNSPVHTGPSPTEAAGPDGAERAPGRRSPDLFSASDPAAPPETEPRRETAGTSDPAHPDQGRSVLW